MESEASMPFRIAIVADSHLPDAPGSAQERTLRRAVEQAVATRVDLLIGLGDLTTFGTLTSARTVIRILTEARLPLLCTPGNAELRTREDAAKTRAIFSTSGIHEYECSGLNFVQLDTSEGRICEAERGRFMQCLGSCTGPLVLFTHLPPADLPSNDLAWLEGILVSRRTRCILAGHKHVDSETKFSGIPVHVFRGLDPDKVRDDFPALAILEFTEDHVLRTEIPFTPADPKPWTADEHDHFYANLGISTMRDSLRGLQEAVEERAPCVEIRMPDAGQCRRSDLLRQIDLWRQTGGRCLSLHLPDLGWDTANGIPAGINELRGAVDLACVLKVNRVTMHVPRVPLAMMESGSTVRSALLAVHRNLFACFTDAEISVGIENLHMQKGEEDNSRRGFGYLPDECLAWIRELKEILPGVGIGLHLDIGHARNNGPFANIWTLGRWYAEYGSFINGYHLHQVRDSGNHQPFRSPFGPSISLVSFLWAWHRQQVTMAPMFLEIRPESSVSSLRILRKFAADLAETPLDE